MPDADMTEELDRIDGLLDRLDVEYGCCAFCGHDPYHYVDNGVGMERKALSVRTRLEFLSKALREHGAQVKDLQVWAHECPYHADDIDDLLALSSDLSRKLETATGLLRRMAETPASDYDAVSEAERIRSFLAEFTEKKVTPEA